MRSEASPADYLLNQTGNNVQALNCGLQGIKCSNTCKQACCSNVGLSVNFMNKSAEGFCKFHMHLYKKLQNQGIPLPAEPSMINSFQLPPPSPAAYSVFSALESLYDYEMSRFSEQGSAAILFDLSVYIVCLCEPSSTVVDASVPAINRQVDRPLAHLLLGAITKGAVDFNKLHWYQEVVCIVANTLGMDAADVYFAHPFLRDDDHAGSRSVVLYGNVVPLTIEYGQGEAHKANLDQEAEKFMLSNPADHDSDISYASLDQTRWDRVEKLKEGAVIARTLNNRSGVRLPLGKTFSTRLFRTAALPETIIDIPVEDIFYALALQSAASITEFIKRSCEYVTPDAIKTLIDTHCEADLRERSYGKNLNAVSKYERTRVIAQAASVVAVFPNCDTKVKEMLQDESISDFVVAYLSCRLRLQMAEMHPEEGSELLPLATRCLMTRDTKRDVDADFMERIPGHILPPMKHHTAFVAVVSLERHDVGHAVGVALALEVKEGIHIARSIEGMRTSFIVWFVDDVVAFDLSLAILRENGHISVDDARLWAGNLVQSCIPHLAPCGLQPKGKTEIAASVGHDKRIIIITWHERMFDLACKVGLEVLERSSAADGACILKRLEASALHTSMPPVAFVRNE